MIRESEAFISCPEALRWIKTCSERIQPDAPELKDWFKLYVDNHLERISFDYDMICRHVQPGSRLLEVGAISLLLTLPLLEKGYDLTALDLNPERFESVFHRRNIPYMKCNIETQPIPMAEDTFDAVIFNEIFEHLRINLIFTMREVLRVLKPGGLLFLSTPNLRSLQGIINFLFLKKSYSCCSDIYSEYLKLEQIQHMGHVREYTIKEVTHFITKIGFVPQKIIYRGTYPTFYKRLSIRLFPSLRPFFSIIAIKKTDV